MKTNSNIEKISNLTLELNNLLPMKDEYQKNIDTKYKLEFNFNSNHIEGNTLTYGQTKLLLMFGESSGNADFRDFEEMKAHNVGLELVKVEAKDKNRPLTESFIRELNKTILVENYWKAAKTESGEQTRIEIKVGEYKSRPNSVITQTGEIFKYASPEETSAMMHDLVHWFNSEFENNNLSPIELATLLHYRYIRIHPFEDGNGRIARLLVNYVLLRYNLPMIIIKTSDKPNYLRLLHQCDVETGLSPYDGANAQLEKLQPFLEYMQNLLIESLEMSIKAAKGENIEDPDDLDKKLKLLEQELSIIDEDDEVKSHFSEEVFLKILNTWGGQLIIKSIPTIQKFNTFFTETKHHIRCGNIWISFVNESASEIFNSILSKIDEQFKKNFQEHNCEITIDTHYGSLKKGGLKAFGCNYGIKIKFDTIKYEVYVDKFSEDGRNTTKMYENLLHKSISEKEIELIIKVLGETVFNHIDFNTKREGLR